MVVERRDPLVGFDIKQLEAALSSRGRGIVVVDDAKVDNYPC